MSSTLKRFLPIICILIAIAAIYVSGAYHYLTFNTLRTYHATLKVFLLAHPISMPLLYTLTYIVLTALSIPGAVFVTLIGGYLFAQPWSTLYVIFGATCGAILIFLAARTAFGETLKQKGAPLLKKMAKGFNENAASYMLFLRLVPIFPFWIVNLAPAVFKVPLKTFVWTTLIGIAPGSFVFTLAGSGLEQILQTHQELSVSAILNTQLKIALCLLGALSLVPILVKKWRKKNKKSND